ncbi:tyrosine-type recombinase/integrase [Sphaerothrix gracilis]|uniref:tyrosine-type recombinase/integrase n=1 Tax=Sphaerothrix gracilis TaxID=3151835 RepID=UPI0031FCDAFB
MPKVNRKGQAEVLSQEQLQQLWSELNFPHALITQLAYYTGSRISEICSLKAEDVSAGKVVIRQHKTERTKEVVIVPPLKMAIASAPLPSTGYLFPAATWTRATVKRYRIQRHSTGGHHFEQVGELGPRPHISTRAVDKALRKACDMLDLEGVSTHTFRRSLATHLYDAGVPLRQIMEITGHASLASLTSYLNIEQRAASDALLSFFAT